MAQADTKTDDTDTPAAPIDAELRGRVVNSMRTLLPRVLKREITDIAEDTCLFDALGLTSSSTLSLILELEDDLDIQIDVEQIDQDDLGTFGTLADFVAANTINED
jgi:acyl carrier protein